MKSEVKYQDVTPVSYTHLDVYKRQVQEHQSISAENPEELELWFPIERI